MVTPIKTLNEELNIGLSENETGRAMGAWAAIRNDMGLEVYPHPIGTVTRAENAIRYCDQVLEEVLLELRSVLNDYHRETNSVSFYRILVGPWLLSFLHHFYEKFLIVKEIGHSIGFNRTRYLDQSQWVVPVDFLDYFEKFSNQDLGAEQQFAQIMQFLNIPGDNEIVKMPLAQSTQISIGRRNSLVSIVQSLMRFTQKLCYRDSVVLSEHYSGWTAYKLSILSGFKFVVDDFRDQEVAYPFQIDWSYRQSKVEGLADTEFKRLVSSAILMNIPAIYLEGYKRLMSTVRGIRRRTPNVIVSATGLSGHNPIISALAANSGDRTFKLLIQHGGNYGTDRINASEELERRLGDLFLYWGRAGVVPSASALPLQAYKERRRVKDCNKRSNITLFLVELPRYVHRFHTGLRPAGWVNDDKRRVFEFLSSSSKIRPNLVIKPYFQDYGWEITTELESAFEWVNIEKRSANHRKLLLQSKICVFPFITTGYLQALAADIPTVIFVDRGFSEFREDAVPLFKRLQNVGILHLSGKSAAEHVELVTDDVFDWWKSVEVVEARQQFLEAYGRTSKQWVKEWKEIRRFALSINQNH